MATTTPAWSIPVPQRPDPFALTADLAKSFAKVDSMGSQATALSNAAVTSSEAAQIAAAQALARALAIEEPVHVGPTPPTDGESIWVDTSEDAPPIPTDVPWEDVTGKPAVFPPEAHTHTWTQVNDKPTTYPPSAHTHDDRYYTEAEVDAKIAAALVGPGTMGNPIDLGTAHLDTRTEPNHYTQRFSARSTKANGYPYEGKAGVLEVLAWIPTNGIIQRWTSQAGGVATRYMLNGNWQAWQNALAQTIT